MTPHSLCWAMTNAPELVSHFNSINMSLAAMTGGIQKTDIHLNLASREMARSARRCHVRGSDPPHLRWGTMVTQRLQVGS